MTHFNNVSIVSVAHVDAPIRISSAQIGEKLKPLLGPMGLRPDLIETLTGIKARRWWEEGVQPSEAATMAAAKAIENSGLDKAELGIIINTSVSKDYIEPSIASLVHGNLGLSPNCMNFDIGNACLAFMNAIEIIGYMIEREQIQYGLIVDGESSRFAVLETIKRLTSPGCTEQVFRDNFATLTLGSGSAAMVLARSDLAPDGHKVVGGVTMAASQHNRLCLGLPDEMVTDASALLVAGIELAERTFEKGTRHLGWGPDPMDEYIVHQVSAIHTEKMARKLGIDPDKIFRTYPEFGNIGPAAVPITLSKSLEAGRIHKGTRIGLWGIGSGLNCTMMEVVW